MSLIPTRVPFFPQICKMNKTGRRRPEGERRLPLVLRHPFPVARGRVLAFSPASFARKSYRQATRSGGVTGPDSNHSDPEPSPRAPLRGARSRERSLRLRLAQTQAPFPTQARPPRNARQEAGSQRSQCGFAPSGREQAGRHDNRPSGARPGPTPPGVRTRLDPPSPVAAHTPPPCRPWEGAGPAA